VYEWHTGCSGAACESHIAAFLVGAGEGAYWGQGGWPGWVLPGRRRAGAANRWMPQYFEKPLGAPLADGIYDPQTQMWSRSFAKGARAWFSAANRSGTGAVGEWGEQS
jgi:hypothetical protein